MIKLSKFCKADFVPNAQDGLTLNFSSRKNPDKAICIKNGQIFYVFAYGTEREFLSFSQKVPEAYIQNIFIDEYIHYGYFLKCLGPKDLYMFVYEYALWCKFL